MTQPPPSPPPAPKRRSGGSIALIVIGLLIAVPSGLCTAFNGVGFLVETLGGSNPDSLESSIMAAVLIGGGVPLLIGVGLLVLGLRMKPK
jgi:hypothetical protein